jgi:hypothetical protein
LFYIKAIQSHFTQQNKSMLPFRRREAAGIARKLGNGGKLGRQHAAILQTVHT